MTAQQATPATRYLDTRSEIHDLVVRFYREILFDELLWPVFIDVAEVDWSTHIPKLIDYWCRVLLSEPGYDGYILHAYREVHEIERFQPDLVRPLVSPLRRNRGRRLARANRRRGQGARSSDRRIAGATVARG